MITVQPLTIAFIMNRAFSSSRFGSKRGVSYFANKRQPTVKKYYPKISTQPQTAFAQQQPQQQLQHQSILPRITNGHIPSAAASTGEEYSRLKFDSLIDPKHQSLETSLLPKPSELKQMIDESMKYIFEDIYRNDHLAPSGIGYHWIHSHDKQEYEKAYKIFQKYQTPMPMNENDRGDINTILKGYFSDIKHCTGDNQPGYMAWLPSGGIVHTAIADFIACATNRSSTMFMVGPVCAAIEYCVIEWFANILGIKSQNENKNTNANTNTNTNTNNTTKKKNSRSKVGGVLTSGGSMATILAVNAAKHKCLTQTGRDDNDITKLTVYFSEQSHYCLDQASQLCGIPKKNLRKIPSNENDCTVKHEMIEQLIKKDIENGMIPMMVNAMAGTTNTGMHIYFLFVCFSLG